MSDKTKLILNSSLELGFEENDGKGKGKYFRSRFIEPGVAHYNELGDILITKETLNKFINTMVGCPVIIDHKDVTDKNVDKLRVGVVSKVWFNEYDGYFYCEGILTDPEAIDLVKNQGWNVSCAYSFVSDNTKRLHNGKEIDMEFTNGEFLHLALVQDPRYEGANIVVNKNDDDLEWITVKGNHIPIKKGQSKDEAVKKFLEDKQSDKQDKEEKQPDSKYDEDEELYDFTDEIEDNEFKRYLKDIKENGWKLDPKKAKMTKGNYTKIISKKQHEKLLKATNSIGDITMSVLNDLKDFIMNTVKNEKEDEMKVKNEDKRKLIDEVGGILKGKVDDEIIRTIMKKMEEASYEPSEDGKADNEEDEKEAKNKCKNEEDKKEDDDKKEEDEKEIDNEEKDEEKEDKKEVKNSMKEVIMGGKTQNSEKKLYISTKERLEEGNKY